MWEKSKLIVEMRESWLLENGMVEQNKIITFFIKGRIG